MKNKNTIVLNSQSLLKTFVSIFFTTTVFCACNAPAPVEKKLVQPENNFLKQPPEKVVQAIKNKFPGALVINDEIDSLLNYLETFGIYPKSMLWGQSICVDDIINTKNKFPTSIKGPFNIGGLAGLPFTGITGLDAFVHHLPEEGAAILFVGPHIGYNENDGWGKILRHEQHHTSTCCGALVAALSSLQKGELKNKVPAQDDYQQGMIEQFAYKHKDEITNSTEPLITLTELIYHEAIRQISIQASKLKEKHFKYVVVVGAIIINTDYLYSDYLSIETVAIRDLQKNEWIQGAKPK